MKLEKALVIIGLNIKRYRLVAGLSQTQLANELLKDQQSIQRLEKGKINATINTLLEISNALNIDLKDLFNCPDNEK